MPGKRKEGKVLVGGYIPVELKRALELMAKARGVTVSALLNAMTEDFVSNFFDDKEMKNEEKRKG